MSDVRRLFALLSMLLGLAACSAGPGYVLRGPNVIALDPAVGTVRVDGVDINIVAPPGFCIDPRGIRATDAGAVAVIGDCVAAGVDTIADEPAPRSPIDAVMTVSAAAEPVLGGVGDLGERLALLEAVVQSPNGRALLARTPVPAGETPARVIQTRRADDTLYALMQDPAGRSPAGAAPRYWRAFTEVRGRMVILTITAFGADYPGDPVALRYLTALRAALRDGNPPGSA
ncbi:MAG: hypothetical protein ACPGID_07615 [Rubricella sp.]